FRHQREEAPRVQFERFGCPKPLPYLEEIAAMRRALIVATAFGLLTSPLLMAPAQAQTIIYLNFDEQEVMDGEGIHDRDPYVLGDSEVGTNLPAPFHELNMQFEWKAGTP